MPDEVIKVSPESIKFLTGLLKKLDKQVGETAKEEQACRLATQSAINNVNTELTALITLEAAKAMRCSQKINTKVEVLKTRVNIAIAIGSTILVVFGSALVKMAFFAAPVVASIPTP